MTDPATHTCALHPDRDADGHCPRCGSFGCTECLAIVPASGQRLCPECRRRREAHLRDKKLGADRRNTIAWWALGFGITGLLPFFWVGWVGAVVCAIVALRRAPHLDGDGQTFALVSLGLATLGLISTITTVALLASSS